MKHSRTLITVALFVFTTLIIVSCKDDDHKIPFDKEKAKEHVIPMKLAGTMVANFQSARDSLARIGKEDSSGLIARFDLPNAEMFNRDAIIALLDADGAEGIRIYLGRDSGKVKMVLLPVNKEGKDIHTMLVDDKTTTQKAAAQLDQFGDDGQAMEVGQRCPTICN
jgi:hypothetical protein